MMDVSLPQSPEIRVLRSRSTIYYIVMSDGTPSDVVEREFYGAIDNYLGHLLQGIFDVFEQGGTPTFSGDSLHALRLFFYETIKRSPEFTKHHDDLLAGKEFVSKILNTPNERLDPALRSDLENQLRNEKALKDYGRDIRVRATIRQSDKIEKALEGFQARWAISKTHHSFVLSSMIAHRIGNGEPNGLKNPKMEMWMPITPKRALVLLKDPENKIPLVAVESPEHIREINEFAARHCRSIGSHSQKLIESITGQRVKV